MFYSSDIENLVIVAKCNNQYFNFVKCKNNIQSLCSLINNSSNNAWLQWLHAHDPHLIFHSTLQEVTPDGDVAWTNPDYSSVYTAKNSKRKDTAVYKITVTNEFGSDSAEMEVVVLGAPARPKGPLEVTDVKANSVKLQWQTPEDDGGAPITYVW